MPCLLNCSENLFLPVCQPSTKVEDIGTVSAIAGVKDRLFAGTSEGHLLLIDPSNASVIETVKDVHSSAVLGVSAVSASPDVYTFVSASESTIAVYVLPVSSEAIDAFDGSALRLHATKQKLSGICNIVLSHDAAYVAITHQDNSTTLWSIPQLSIPSTTGQPPSPVPGKPRPATLQRKASSPTPQKQHKTAVLTDPILTVTPPRINPSAEPSQPVTSVAESVPSEAPSTSKQQTPYLHFVSVVAPRKPSQPAQLITRSIIIWWSKMNTIMKYTLPYAGGTP